jgi:hypothetical protein
MWEIVTLLPYSRSIATKDSFGVTKCERSGSARMAAVVGRAFFMPLVGLTLRIVERTVSRPSAPCPVCRDTSERCIHRPSDDYHHTGQSI